MGKVSDIEWCDSAINPVTGCEGCELWNGKDVRRCYAGEMHETRLARALPALYASSFQEVRLAPGRMKTAAGWDDLRGKARPEKPWLDDLPRLIFVGNLGDFASREVPDDYLLDEVFRAIQSPKGQRHFWLLLTKHPNRLIPLAARLGGQLPENCMAMTTATNQHTAATRIRDLQRVPARWKGVSLEPMDEAIDLYRAANGTLSAALDWIILGAESGAGPRPLPLAWVEDVRSWCQDAATPFFYKQDWRDGALISLPEIGGRQWTQVPHVMPRELREVTAA